MIFIYGIYSKEVYIWTTWTIKEVIAWITWIAWTVSGLKGNFRAIEGIEAMITSTSF